MPWFGGTEDSFREFVLPFRVNPQDQTQILKLSSKNPY